MTSSPSPLPRVRLGGDGPMIGTIGLGCMGMSELYGDTDEGEARATLDRALELGVTLFDTADMYGLGENERFLAPSVRANRNRIAVDTKFGFARTPEQPDNWSIDNRPEHIRAAAERSLGRLGVETIDLYYMHRRDPDVQLADSVGAMARLVEEGKVRQLGLCAVSATSCARRRPFTRSPPCNRNGPCSPATSRRRSCPSLWSSALRSVSTRRSAAAC
jgi:aryl-alcohol dehydrogenase-like predicted oxidoreductase